MKLRTSVVLAVLILCSLVCVYAADISGKWTAEFDSQVGLQKYTYEFTVDGTTFTGKASATIAGADMEAEIVDGKIDGDKISFTENLEYTGMPLSITYTGTVSGDEMNLSRDVAGQGGETFTAKRVK
ncbi:MAG: hypothetical protein JXR49_23240 [Acidobacteria bacterium]|nr:hypothetical protein [Acidobacteriota bacterium]